MSVIVLARNLLTSTLKGDTWRSQIILDFGGVLFILSWKM